jgi:hypothetical protein
MLEFGFKVTDYGKTLLAACLVTELGAVRLIIAPSRSFSTRCH